MSPDRRTWRRTDLVVRLPIAGAALIAIALTTFLLVSYQQVTRALTRAGHVRAQAAADQLASLLTPLNQQLMTELQKIGQDAAVRAFLEAPDEAKAADARKRLAPLSRPGQPVVEIWSRGGVHLLSGPPPSPERPVPAIPAMTAPAAEGVSPFHDAGGAIYWNTVSAAPGGYIVARRVLSGASNPEAISRLVGAGAVIKLGDTSGNVWSDLAKRTPSPAGEVRAGAVISDRDQKGSALDGAASAVRGTPWVVLVEFPRAATIAPAQAYLLRMLLAAGLLVLFSAAAAAALSARITTPLRQLTLAAEAIAAGRFEEPVAIHRRDEIGRLATAFRAMAADVQSSRLELERRVEERTNAVVALNHELERRLADLKALTGELESFSYSVSHDLRAPLRHITGFANLLEQRSQGSLDDESARYVRTIVAAGNRMGRLVDDLLTFSRMARTEMLQNRVELGPLVKGVVEEVAQSHPDRRIRWHLLPLPAVRGDAAMLRLAFTNLVSNAVKYTATRETADIEIGTVAGDSGERVIYVKDNGVGFDMQYVEKLFGVFQRLHSADSFEGTGIGLANVRRIVQRHGGRTWAMGTVDGGATFFLSLPEWTGAGESALAAAI